MPDYKSLNLDANLVSNDSLANQGASPMTGFDFRTKYERGLVKPYHAGTLYTLSNAGTVSPIIIGAAGSGTETLIVTSTLANVRSNRLFATHEMDFYEGTVSAVGTARLFGATSSVPYSDYIIMHWNSWGQSDQLNMVAQNVVRNTRATTTTVNCVDQWRYLVPPGDVR
jgi:hypothetical protein